MLDLYKEVRVYVATLPTWRLEDDEGVWLLLADSMFAARRLYCTVKPADPQDPELPKMVQLVADVESIVSRHDDLFGRDPTYQTRSATRIHASCRVVCSNRHGEAETYCYLVGTTAQLPMLDAEPEQQEQAATLDT